MYISCIKCRFRWIYKRLHLVLRSEVLKSLMYGRFSVQELPSAMDDILCHVLVWLRPFKDLLGIPYKPQPSIYESARLTVLEWCMLSCACQPFQKSSKPFDVTQSRRFLSWTKTPSIYLLAVTPWAWADHYETSVCAGSITESTCCDSLKLTLVPVGHQWT